MEDEIKVAIIDKEKLRKRLIKKNLPKQLGRANDVYITTKTAFKTQRKYCENLLNAGYNEIYLHCVGKAISCALHLTLDIIYSYSDTLTYTIHTSTIYISDELHPLCDDDDIAIQKRKNSAIHIKIYRRAPINLDFAL